MGWVLRVFQSRKSSLMWQLAHQVASFIHSWNFLSFLCSSTAASSGIRMESETHIQAIEAIQRTFTYKITEVKHLKLLGKLRTQIVLSSETLWTLYNYIYLEDNTAYGAEYWWHNGAQNKNQKTPKTWNTVRYSVSYKQKPSTIPSRKCNNSIWASFVQLVAKISER